MTAPARGWLRGVAAVAALLAAAGLLGLAVHGQSRPTPLDAWFYTGVAGPVGHQPVARWLLLVPTRPVLVALLVLGVAGVSAYRGHRRLAVLALAAPALAVCCASLLLKPVFGRTYHGYLAYPSGHTAFLVAALAVLVIAARRLAVVAVLVACLGMLGLVAGGYHYLTDTVGAAALACAVTVALRLAVMSPGTGRSAASSRQACSAAAGLGSSGSGT